MNSTFRNIKRLKYYYYYYYLHVHKQELSWVIIIIIIITIITILFVCLLLGINVFVLQCLPLITLWFYVVFAHNVITCNYTVLCL
jgi:hypothetical protein